MRLNLTGIFTSLDFYNATIPTLRKAFGGICGYYWFLRLHGWEIDARESTRKSYGNSYALYRATNDNNELSRILCKLVAKMGKRLRKAGFFAKGIHMACLFKDYKFWHHGHKVNKQLYTNSDLYQEALKILINRPSREQLRILAVSCYDLEENPHNQLCLFKNEEQKYQLAKAVDQINEKWGDFMVTSARMMGMDDKIIDRIAFGGVKELEEYIFEEPQ